MQNKLPPCVNKLLGFFEYKEKYGTHPTRSILETILRTELDAENDLVKQQVRDFFARAQTNEEEVRDSEYVKEHALEFCKKQKLKEAMSKINLYSFLLVNL